MIHYLINLLSRLIEAIKRGILRIFPLPLRPCLYALAILTVLTVYSCASTRPVTQLVRDVQRDTIYLNSQQYDSIYIYQDRLLDRSRDTIYLKDVSIEYRYKLLRDTIKVVQRDSIPYEVVRIETKEITRPLTAYDKVCRITFWLVIAFILSFIVMKFRKYFFRP